MCVLNKHKILIFLIIIIERENATTFISITWAGQIVIINIVIGLGAVNSCSVCLLQRAVDSTRNFSNQHARVGARTNQVRVDEVRLALRAAVGGAARRGRHS